MKKNKGLIYLLIALMVILIIVLLGVMIVGISGKNISFFGVTNVSNELILEKEYDNIFSKLDLNIESGNISIINSNDDKVHVKIFGDKNSLTIKDNETLNITYKSKNCIGFCFNNEISKVEISIPDEEVDININSDYGDIEIGNLINSRIIIDNDYGNTKIGKVKAIEIDSDAGNIKIDEVEKVKIDIDYGQVDIKKVNSYVNIQSDCGDVSIDELFINTNSSINSDLGQINIGKTNEIYIDAKTDLGKVSINNNNNKSDITLKLDNDCGDIKVSN